MLAAEGVMTVLLATMVVYFIKAGVREWRGVSTRLSQRSLPSFH